MKSSLYLETTIPIYLNLADEPGSDNCGHQEIPRESQRARERLKVLQELLLPDIAPEVTELATGMLASGSIPRKAATDAAHIAIAAVHGMDFLVTWHCVHIANAAIYQ